MKSAGLEVPADSARGREPSSSVSAEPGERHRRHGGERPLRSGGEGRLLKKIRHLAGQAFHDYNLIEDGQTVLIGVSGGKDSLVLTRFMAELKKRVPIKFTLGAAHLGRGRAAELAPWLDGLGLDFVHWEPAPEVPELAAYRPGGPSPCFACARARRNRLFELARRYGAGRLALGHHLDDAIETFLMNAFFSGRLEGLAPRQDLFEGRLAIIRPFFLVPEEFIIRLAAEWRLPIMPSLCPADGHTVRQEMKDLVAELTRRNPKVFGNLTAVARAAAGGAPASFGRKAGDL